MPLDQINLSLDSNGLMIINIAISLLMLGVAIDTKWQDFKHIIVFPKAVAIGLFAQFICLPFITFCLVKLLNPIPSIALGMILISSCPGGNISNIMTYLANGNTSVSIVMTAISSIAAIVLTPLIFSFWASLSPDTSNILENVIIDPRETITILLTIIGLPIFSGLVVSNYYPRLADYIKKPLKLLSFLFFILIVSVVVIKNISNIKLYLSMIFLYVFIHNATAFAIGYSLSHISRLPVRDRRAVTIEIGIQNAALGLVIVFSYFNNFGGMLAIVSWWGIWHIIAGLFLAIIFNCPKTVNVKNEASE